MNEKLNKEIKILKGDQTEASEIKKHSKLKKYS